MDSATGSWVHGHAAIGYKKGTVEIIEPKYKVSVYGESRLKEWYDAKTGGFYTVRGANKEKNDAAAAMAYKFKDGSYITVNALNGYTCVSVVTKAWTMGGEHLLLSNTPVELAFNSDLVRQFKWTDVRYE